MKRSNIFKIGLTLTLAILASTGFGQSLDEIKAANESMESFNISMATVLYIFAIILVFIASGMMLIAVHLKRYVKGEFSEEYAKRTPVWQKIFQIKPLSSDKDTVINHPHDGIYELDNPPPPWFMFLFYSTIVFAVIYYVRFTFTDSGYTQAEEYAMEVKEAEAKHAKFLTKAGDAIDETNVELLTSEADLAKGKSIFESMNCGSCHGEFGQGIIGPNFTDKYWKLGGDVKDVFKTIKYGTPNGMQAWSQSMGAKGMQAVASYVISLEGTTLPAGIKGKPAEGELFDRNAAGSENTPEVTDSTATRTTDSTSLNE